MLNQMLLLAAIDAAGFFSSFVFFRFAVLFTADFLLSALIARAGIHFDIHSSIFSAQRIRLSPLYTYIEKQTHFVL